MWQWIADASVGLVVNTITAVGAWILASRWWVNRKKEEEKAQDEKVERRLNIIMREMGVGVDDPLEKAAIALYNAKDKVPPSKKDVLDIRRILIQILEILQEKK